MTHDTTVFYDHLSSSIVGEIYTAIYFFAFRKRLVYIGILELGPVSNKIPGYFILFIFKITFFTLLCYNCHFSDNSVKWQLKHKNRYFFQNFEDFEFCGAKNYRNTEMDSIQWNGNFARLQNKIEQKTVKKFIPCQKLCEFSRKVNYNSVQSGNGSMVMSSRNIQTTTQSHLGLQYSGRNLYTNIFVLFWEKVVNIVTSELRPV